MSREEMIIVYFAGYILALLTIFIADRTILKNELKTSLQESLIMSLASFLLVIMYLLKAIQFSNMYKKIDNLWKYGKYEL